jgi:PhzF family phenazine biosynthesis protein
LRIDAHEILPAAGHDERLEAVSPKERQHFLHRLVGEIGVEPLPAMILGHVDPRLRFGRKRVHVHSGIEVRRHPPCLASCGAPFVIAEVRDRATLRRAQQRMDVFLSRLPRDEVTGIHLYVEDAEEGADFQSRMFAPLHGVFEDPATGSANVALIGLLAHLRPESSLRLKAAIGQGVDLGRPSLLRAVAEKVEGAVIGTFIGGGCKPVMSGWIDLQ